MPTPWGIPATGGTRRRSRSGRQRHAAGGCCPGVSPGLVSWRPWLEDRALRQMQGLPPEAFDMLVRTLARICDDPYDPVFSVPVPPVPGRPVDDLDAACLGTDHAPDTPDRDNLRTSAAHTRGRHPIRAAGIGPPVEPCAGLAARAERAPGLEGHWR